LLKKINENGLAKRKLFFLPGKNKDRKNRPAQCEGGAGKKLKLGSVHQPPEEHARECQKNTKQAKSGYKTTTPRNSWKKHLYLFLQGKKNQETPAHFF
jgi:hypothetical protein